MRKIDRILDSLARLANNYAFSPGVASAVPRLTLHCCTKASAPTPALFGPGFHIVLQGTARLAFSDTAYDFTAGSCGLSAISLPAVHQVTEASPARPYIAAEFKLDPGVLAEVLLTLPDGIKRDPASFATAALDSTIGERLSRLLRLLAQPADADIRAEALERELWHSLLYGTLGGPLRQVGHQGSRFAQVRAAADWIAANADKSFKVEQLAVAVGLSAQSLPGHFKAVTGYGPIAYRRHLRLLEARRLLLTGALPVMTTALAVGYSSASQFSREYKGMFGEPPLRDVKFIRPKHNKRSRPARSRNRDSNPDMSLAS